MLQLSVLNRESKKGLTPLLAAALEGHEDTFSLMMECGANLYARTNFGEDAQSLAHGHHKTAIVNLIDQEVYRNLPSSLLRSEAGLVPGDDDEWSDGNRTPVIGIQDGPEAFERFRINKNNDSIGTPPSGEHTTSKPYPISKSPRGSASEFTGGSFEEHFFIKSGSTVKSATLHAKLIKVNQQDSPPSPSIAREFGSPNYKEPQLPDITSFLAELKLDKFIPLFMEKGIDFQNLLALTENELQDIGVKPFGPRRKIFSSVDKWKKSHTQPGSVANEIVQSPKFYSHLEATPLQQALAQIQALQTQLSQERRLHSLCKGSLMEHRTKGECTHGILSELQKMLKQAALEIDTLKTVKDEMQNCSSLDQENPNFNYLAGKLENSIANLEKCILPSSQKVDLILEGISESPSCDSPASHNRSDNTFQLS